MSNDPNKTGSPDLAADKGKPYVGQYPLTTPYPFEIGEVVWIVKPEYRAPLGEYVITQAHPHDYFELRGKSDNALYSELVEGKYLTRDPFAMGS